MPFVALDRAMQLVAALPPLLDRIAMRDPDLAGQIRRAAFSIPLNLAEGRKRMGRDRAHLWRVADGSNEEVRTALRVAVAWGYLKEPVVEPALALCDELAAMLWTLTKERRPRR